MIKVFSKTAGLNIINFRKNALKLRILKIISSSNNPDFTTSQNNFEDLQLRYESRPEYGYDQLSLFKRAADRAFRILNLPGLNQPGLKGIDIACGDGMLGILLEKFGHEMTLHDVSDWRVITAKSLRMITADCCKGLPIENDSYDFIVSFNAFEHFLDPETAMSEIVRITRPGGIIYLSFGPLYCGPWGLHAYRTLRMPYPQFLFSNEFINKKLKELGIWDLGSKRDELQYVNCWRPHQYESLWMRPDLSVLSCQWHIKEQYLNLITEYPECFCGLGLTLRDLVSDGLTLSLRKNA